MGISLKYFLLKIQVRTMKFAAVIVVFALVASAYADVYMHNPRGGNNRVDDANNAPANRPFDSQNNNQAGYNSGEEGVNMKYYQSSELMIGWTSQHGCGINPQTHCDMIIQYRCDTLMRNGVSRERPEDNLDTAESEPSADRGRHEPYSNWLECRTRDRNEGLFIADQNVGGQARNTRQNAGGGRSGYECAEERDYYPYWHPSMWKDIAVMTDNTTRSPTTRPSPRTSRPRAPARPSLTTTRSRAPRTVATGSRPRPSALPPRTACSPRGAAPTSTATPSSSPTTVSSLLSRPTTTPPSTWSRPPLASSACATTSPPTTTMAGPPMPASTTVPLRLRATRSSRSAPAPRSCSSTSTPPSSAVPSRTGRTSLR